jgi:stromal membrane-associated protein
MALQEQINVINKMLKKPENKLCADCKRPSPSWASINLGVFVCIVCSGCHREIGVHVTKIKSINLDLWPKKVLNNFKKISKFYNKMLMLIYR